MNSGLVCIASIIQKAFLVQVQLDQVLEEINVIPASSLRGAGLSGSLGFFPFWTTGSDSNFDLTFTLQFLIPRELHISSYSLLCYIYCIGEFTEKGVPCRLVDISPFLLFTLCLLRTLLNLLEGNTTSPRTASDKMFL